MSTFSKHNVQLPLVVSNDHPVLVCMQAMGAQISWSLCVFGVLNVVKHAIPHQRGVFIPHITNHDMYSNGKTNC